MDARDFQRVEALYHAALQRPSGEREAFLRDACGDDGELLREVESLLGFQGEAGRLLREPAAGAATEPLALVRGARLGPYEILEPLGAGGVGEVYRARDTRLERSVAVKVLRGGLAADPRWRARFEREARAISALAHPNICTLHDVGEQDGQVYLVMEHLEGQNLAERLGKGPLPLGQALDVAAQIADALAAAHKRGVVHRDLKPGNVMLTKTGARLLDFGLARVGADGGPAAVKSGEPAGTKQATLTGEGTILGTLPYMSPEQVEGRPADARSDLWALGAILYEMATGARAFEAATPAGLVAAILERDPPPLGERQPLAPPTLERLVRRCLARDPDERWDTAHDMAVRLREIAEANTEAAAQMRPPSAPRWTALAVVAVAALMAGVLTDRLWLRPLERARPARVVRSEVDLPAGLPLTSRVTGRRPSQPFRTELALSPDGTLLVWTGRVDGDDTRSALHVRRLDTGEVTRLAGTAEASQPFFSPDGRWLGFYAGTRSRNHRLRKMSVDGGLPVDLAELPSWPMGAAWGPDGTIYLGTQKAGIYQVPAEGGAPRQITTPDRAREVGHRFPALLPDGRALLFTVMRSLWGGTTRVEALSLTSGERKVVVKDGADARPLPSGHLVFVRRGTLMAAPFDLERLELAAPPIPVVEGVSQALDVGYADLNSGAAQFAVSDSGLLIYAPGGINEIDPVELVVLDEGGRAEALPGFDKRFISPQFHFSPDGRRLAFVEQAPIGLLWLFDVERQTYRALSDQGIAGSPRWSPDGDRLVTNWSEGGVHQLWEVPVRGGEWSRLTDGDRNCGAPSWSPDGRFLAFVLAGPPSSDIYLYRFEDRRVVPFLTTEASETHPEFSPDGRWLAYRSFQNGRSEIFLTSFPDREETLTVSRPGGYAPAWSRDGQRLYYYSYRPHFSQSAALATATPVRPAMMAVDVRHGPELSLGQPSTLFRLPQSFISMGPERSYDLHPDGRRFLVGVGGEREPPPPITRLRLVQGWFAELERRVPTGS